MLLELSIIAAQTVVFANLIQEGNWTVVQEPAEVTTVAETKLFAPYYVDYSPCECDLTEGSCDLSCCCDPSCPDDTKEQVFNCPKSQEEIKRSVDCHLPLVVRRDEMFMFLCLFRENNPLLGHFYQEPTISRSDIHYSEAIRNAQQEARDRDFNQVFHSPVENVITSTYSVGSPLSTSASYLALPQTTLNGQCSWLSPIRFLQPLSSTCLVRLTEITCISHQFDVASYITPKPNLLENRQRPVAIFGQAAGHQSRIPVTVKYLCRSNNRRKIATPSKDEQHLFDLNWTAKKSSDALEECTILPGRTVPDSPKLLDGSFCQNAVTDVQYNFWWNSSEIRNLSATVIIEDLAISDTLIAQRFSASWHHAFDDDKPVSESENGEIVTPAFRSGNPGYMFGYPTISAVEELDGQLRIDSSKQLFVWQTDHSTLCAFAKPGDVMFGANSTSSCSVQLQQKTFDDCAQLRNAIFEGHGALHTPTHISKLGNPKYAKNFVQILRQNMTAIDYLISKNEFEENINSTDDQQKARWPSYPLCEQIPYHSALDIFYTEAAHINGTSVFEIVGAYQYFNYTTWRFSSRFQAEKFLLVTSVRFFPKSVIEATDTKRYNLQERRFHCPSYVTCWDELAYPLMQINIGNPYAYSLAMTLFTVLGIIVGYAVTKPWST